MINILVVSSKYPPEPSGSGLRAYHTYQRLAAKFNIHYEVLCSSVKFNRTERYSHEGVPVYRIASKIFKNIEGGYKLARKIAHGVNYLSEGALTWGYLLRNGRRFDLIHLFGNSGYMTPAVLTYAKMTDKPSIIESCNVPNDMKPFYEPLIAKMLFGKGLPRRSQVVCISRRLKEMWNKSGSSGGREIWCRPNPVDVSRFFMDRAKKMFYRDKLGLFGKEDIVMVTVGKIRPLKNQIFLIDVLKDLPREYKLVIAGPPISDEPYAGKEKGYLDQMKSKIEAYGLADRVRLEERFIENVDEYIKASDIYLLPSKMEACATALLEALACGIPTVAHRIEGVTTDWIQEGVNGYLAPLEEKAFRGKISLARQLGVQGLEDSAHKLIGTVSTEIVDREYKNLINGLLDG